jgi:hypothetical protein
MPRRVVRIGVSSSEYKGDSDAGSGGSTSGPGAPRGVEGSLVAGKIEIAS